jgi:hypothetical protein
MIKFLFMMGKGACRAAEFIVAETRVAGVFLVKIERSCAEHFDRK